MVRDVRSTSREKAVLSGGGWKEALLCVVRRVTPFSLGDPRRGSAEVAGDGSVVIIFGGARGVWGRSEGRGVLVWSSSTSSNTSPYFALGAGIEISGLEREEDDPCLSLDPPLDIPLA